MNRVLNIAVLLAIGGLLVAPCFSGDQPYVPKVRGIWDCLNDADETLKKEAPALLRGLRSPGSEGEQTTLESATTKGGLAGCQKWLYPTRPEFWTYPPDILDGPTPQEMCGTLLTKLAELQAFGEAPEIDGNFKKSGAAKNKLPLAYLAAAVLAYLALIIPGMIMNPGSSEFMSLSGTLVGSLEALKGRGLTGIAKHAKLGGFTLGAIAEGIELARAYQNSSAAGETAGTTAGRLAISAIPDIAAFAASAMATEAMIGAAVAAAPVVGAIGAGALAVGGAAMATYGISTAATAAKTWASAILMKAAGS